MILRHVIWNWPIIIETNSYETVMNIWCGNMLLNVTETHHPTVKSTVSSRICIITSVFILQNIKFMYGTQIIFVST